MQVPVIDLALVHSELPRTQPDGFEHLLGVLPEGQTFAVVLRSFRCLSLAWICSNSLLRGAGTKDVLMKFLHGFWWTLKFITTGLHPGGTYILAPVLFLKIESEELCILQ